MTVYSDIDIVMPHIGGYYKHFDYIVIFVMCFCAHCSALMHCTITPFLVCCCLIADRLSNG